MDPYTMQQRCVALRALVDASLAAAPAIAAPASAVGPAVAHRRRAQPRSEPPNALMQQVRSTQMHR